VFKSVRPGRILAALAITALFTAPALAWPPGGNGGGNGGGGNGGGGEDPPPSYNLPPFSYAVATILVEGMGEYYDTNDYGVTGVSVRPLNVSAFIDTGYDPSAAALVHPDGSVDYLDNLIDPDLPYDLGAAVDVNNAGQVLASGFVDEIYGYDNVRAFLLSPNPDAATDGYAYDTILIPLPDWGPGWSYSVVFNTLHLTEAGDALYLVEGRFTDDSYDSSNYLRLSDGTIEDLGAHTFNDPSGWSIVREANSQGTLRVEASNYTTNSDYLVEADGTIVSPEALPDTTNVQINDLAENGYSCGIQTVVTGQVKIRGTWYTQYRKVPVVYDLFGNVATAPFREDMEINSSWRVLNEQLVGGLPVSAGVDNRFPDFCLSCPTYDAAYVSELMDDANRNAFRDLFYSANPAGTNFTLATPRLPNGDVDDASAPTFWCELEGVVYPNGDPGHAGIYVVYPVSP